MANGGAGPTPRFWVNLAALFVLLVANGAWLKRYTSWLDESDALWALGGLFFTVVGWVLTRVIKELVPADWYTNRVKNVMFLLDNSWVALVFTVVLGLEAALSLPLGGLELEDPAGTSGSLRVAVRAPGDGEPDAPADWEPWDAKKQLHDGPWFVRNWKTREVSVFIQGVPRRTVKMHPWWRSGDATRLEYPADFVRPVVLITAEKQLVRYADEAAGLLAPYTLLIRIGDESIHLVTFDGRSVWIGCLEADRIRVPAEARDPGDWEDSTERLLTEKVLRPVGYKNLARAIPVGATVSAQLFDGNAKPRCPVQAVTAFQPPGPDRQVQCLVLRVPK